MANDDPYQIGPNAPITHSLHLKREEIVHRINNSGSQPLAVIVETAVNGLLDLTADILVAIHQLETGEPPKFRSELTGKPSGDGGR